MRRYRRPLIYVFYILDLLFLFLAAPYKCLADVYLNEVSPRTTPEWVELYSDETAISIDGYLIYFHGDTSSSQKIGLSGQMTGNFYVAETLSSWLNNNGDTIILMRDGQEVDRVVYGSGGDIGAPGDGKILARVPDGGNWEIVTEVTRNLPNPTPSPTPTILLTNTPIPAESPTNTPLPTATLTMAPTLTPTKKPTATLTPTITLTPVPSPSLMPTSDVGEVLGETQEAGPSGDSSPSGFVFNRGFFAGSLVIAGGLLIVGVAIWPKIVKMIKR